MIPNWLKLVYFHEGNINPIQPGLQGGGYKVPALTLSIHKFLNIEQTLQKLETFPKTYLRTIIWFDT